MDVCGADSEVLIRVEKELQGIAAELNQIAQEECGQVIKRISESWKGENAENYCKKMMEMQERMACAGKRIQGISS